MNACPQLAVAVLGTMPLLWYSADLGSTRLAAWSAAIVAALWVAGAVMQGRLRVGAALAIDAALAIAIAIA